MELILDKNKCTGCGQCVEVCPFGAIELKDGLPVANDECRLCGVCVRKCPEGALALPEKAKKRDIQDARDVWVYAEQKGNDFTGVVYELLGKGRELAQTLGQRLVAVVIGHEVEKHAHKLINYGVDVAYVIDHPELKDFNEKKYAQVLIDLIKANQPNIFLAGATPRGRSLIPQVAAALETGLTADCTGLEIDPDTSLLLQTRPAYGGNIMATITCAHTRPQMATVRPHIFPRPEALSGHEGKIVKVEVEALPQGIEVLSFVQAEIEGPDLTEADVVIGVGRGIKGPENLKLIEKLACLLNAQIGGTRAVVDAGWLSHRYQIGQTGLTISPKLYIACGISGAVQHIVGIQSAKTIVAINKDPEAPIFEVADYGIVGDLFEVIPALIEEIKTRRGESS